MPSLYCIGSQDSIQVVQLILKVVHLCLLGSQLSFCIDLFYLALLLLAGQHFNGGVKPMEYFFSRLPIGRIL